MKRFMVIATVFGLMCLTAAGAHANLLVNGGFETGTNPGSYLTLSSFDTTSIPGWTIQNGSIDYIGTYWTPAGGSRSLDMNGLGGGFIHQSFSTTPGATYTVSFAMAGNPDGPPTTKNLNVSLIDGNFFGPILNGGNSAFTFDTTGHDKTNMGWETKTFNFVAGASGTTFLDFSTVGITDQVNYGPALDDVVVTPIPPSALLLGSGLLGFVGLRRRFRK